MKFADGEQNVTIFTYILCLWLCNVNIINNTTLRHILITKISHQAHRVRRGLLLETFHGLRLLAVRLTTVSSSKTAEPIKVPLEVWTQVGPMIRY